MPADPDPASTGTASMPEPMKPRANRTDDKFPATGWRAWAASAALLMVVTPGRRTLVVARRADIGRDFHAVDAATRSTTACGQDATGLTILNRASWPISALSEHACRERKRAAV
jgi:hypothetical protein